MKMTGVRVGSLRTCGSATIHLWLESERQRYTGWNGKIGLSSLRTSILSPSTFWALTQETKSSTAFSCKPLVFHSGSKASLGVSNGRNVQQGFFGNSPQDVQGDWLGILMNSLRVGRMVESHFSEMYLTVEGTSMVAEERLIFGGHVLCFLSAGNRRLRSLNRHQSLFSDPARQLDSIFSHRKMPLKASGTA